MSDEVQLSKGVDSGNQGSTEEKYPKLGDMTAEEQDAYFAEGLDSEDLRKFQEQNKNEDVKAMQSKEGVVVRIEVGLGLSDHNSGSSMAEIPKGVSGISSEEDKIVEPRITEKGTKLMEVDGGLAEQLIPQAEATSAQGLNSPPSIPNSQGSITDGIDNVSLNHRVDGDVNSEQTVQGVVVVGVRPPSTPPPASSGQMGQQGEQGGEGRRLRSTAKSVTKAKGGHHGGTPKKTADIPK
jgi:hypothetical protein